MDDVDRPGRKLAEQTRVVVEEPPEGLPGVFEGERDEMDATRLPRHEDRQLVGEVSGGRRRPPVVGRVGLLRQVRQANTPHQGTRIGLRSPGVAL